MVELLMTPAEVAVLLGVTPEYVRQLERRGKLVAAFKTGSGGRLFRPEAVAAFKAQRERERRVRETARSATQRRVTRSATKRK